MGELIEKEEIVAVIEWIACGFGFAAVLLTIFRSVWCWPIGLVQVALFVVVFYQNRLYADMILHVIYVVLQFYGWFAWLRSRRHSDTNVVTQPAEAISVDRCGRREMLCIAIIVALGAALWGYLLATYTNARAPYIDSFIASASLMAQLLLAHRKLENWILWIIVDVVAVGLYFEQNLRVTSMLYLVFLGLAVYGLWTWHVQWTREISSEKVAGVQ